MRQAFAGVALAALLSGPAVAGFKTGTDLAPMCLNPGNSLLIFYAMGAHDAAEVVDGVEKNKFVCPPHGVTGGQMEALFCKYLKENPDKWTMPASALLYNAEIQAFPCAK